MDYQIPTVVPAPFSGYMLHDQVKYTVLHPASTLEYSPRKGIQKLVLFFWE